MEKNIIREIASLPVAARQEVFDLVDFLKVKYSSAKMVSIKAKPTKLKVEKFIGMWKGRGEMAESTEWVRDLRRCEWIL
jgi:hypothetical protein